MVKQCVRDYFEYNLQTTFYVIYYPYRRPNTILSYPYHRPLIWHHYHSHLWMYKIEIHNK